MYDVMVWQQGQLVLKCLAKILRRGAIQVVWVCAGIVFQISKTKFF